MFSLFKKNIYINIIKKDFYLFNLNNNKSLYLLLFFPIDIDKNPLVLLIIVL